MAGLSSRERTGCNSLLNLMSESDLRSLFDTVTNSHRPIPRSVEDLKEAILFNSNDAVEFLKRRKVQRGLILQYLATQEILMPHKSEITPLIERTLLFWSSDEQFHGQRGELPQAATREDARNAQPEWSHQGPLLEGMIQSVGTQAETPLDQSGEPFCSWFFQLLNSQNPAIDQNSPEWGRQHFCNDAKLNIIYSRIGQNSGLYHGADRVNSGLLSLVREFRLLLYPSTENCRYQVVNNLNREVLLAVGGTVQHEPSNGRLGYFEQVFGLIYSRMGGYKIKFTDLIIGLPGIPDGGGEKPPKVTWDFDELKLRF
ncbi:uncharacterized protein C3orf38 homolog isoform X1 [Gadus macrocephalus]|uniref:uncharacterized protein C3orf38 homolog isoform X1 n=1 Tax=Gadus macrocephalus TaxID=80720 RepID=UPI0028CBA1C7|nr:uncharacterized protein C3orf38 homolog isoform X1 [Gadus macrocephalus]